VSHKVDAETCDMRFIASAVALLGTIVLIAPFH
jgi:hypothetical protein